MRPHRTARVLADSTCAPQDARTDYALSASRVAPPGRSRGVDAHRGAAPPASVRSSLTDASYGTVESRGTRTYQGGHVQGGPAVARDLDYDPLTGRFREVRGHEEVRRARARPPRRHHRRLHHRTRGLTSRRDGLPHGCTGLGARGGRRRRALDGRLLRAQPRLDTAPAHQRGGREPRRRAWRRRPQRVHARLLGHVVRARLGGAQLRAPARQGRPARRRRRDVAPGRRAARSAAQQRRYQRLRHRVLGQRVAPPRGACAAASREPHTAAWASAGPAPPAAPSTAASSGTATPMSRSR